MKVIYKYLWNRNINAAKAPERIKRTIMLTPVSLGGFGMVEIKDLADSLNLRSYGRLVITEHPFFKQVRDLIDSNNFFNVMIKGRVDQKLTESNQNSIKFNDDYKKLSSNILSWSNKYKYLLEKSNQLEMIEASLTAAGIF